jgi:hypothetical protein
MSTNSHCIRSSRAVARYLGIASVLLATIGLCPAVAAADDATYQTAAAPSTPEQQQASASAPQRTATGLLLSVGDAGIVLHRSAEPDLRLAVDRGTRVALDGRSASVSDLRRGSEVRASYQETNGVAKAIRIDARRGDGSQPVQTMSPDDPEWDSVHQGG